MLHIVAVIVLIALAVGLYRAKSNAARTEAHVRALSAEIAEREARLRELRAEIAERESPANIARLNEEVLGRTVGSESAALPERAIAERLPAPRREKAGP
jgi:hypothetical protein